MLNTQAKDKDQQIRVAVHAIKVDEKQIKDLTEEPALQDSQHNQAIESINILLKETEESTQQQVDWP